MIRISNPTIHRRHNLLKLLKHFGALDSFVQQTNTVRNTIGRNIAKSKELNNILNFHIFGKYKTSIIYIIYINMNYLFQNASSFNELLVLGM